MVLSGATLLRWWIFSGSPVAENVYCISTKQHGGIKSGVSWSKNSTISQTGVCWCTVLLKGTVNVKLFPPTCGWKWSFWAILCLHWLSFNSLSLVNQMNFTIEAEQLSAPVATSKFVLAAHYDASLNINSHILLKHFELVFLPLHLVKIRCKLIFIWVNYERKKKGAFMKCHVYCICLTWCTSVLWCWWLGKIGKLLYKATFSCYMFFEMVIRDKHWNLTHSVRYCCNLVFCCPSTEKLLVMVFYQLRTSLTFLQQM